MYAGRASVGTSGRNAPFGPAGVRQATGQRGQRDRRNRDSTAGRSGGGRDGSTYRATAASRGRQKLLAVWGQVQSYAFQIELLKRCDPTVALRFLGPLKANALTTRYIIYQLRDGFESQRGCRLTALTCSVWLALKRAAAEGEKLIAALNGYAASKNARAFFDASMGLSERCRFHADCSLSTYGGTVSTDVKFLHDVENVLKQLNYCHLIVSAADALLFMDGIERFLLDTTASGGVVPQEVYDPSHPCSVCFEELCVTANRGESATKRVVGKICDHVTKQVRVRVARDEIAGYLPHASHVDKAKRDAAMAALERLPKTGTASGAARGSGGNAGSVPGEHQGASVREAADAALDEHNVFVPASGSLYAVSELKFWLASSGERGTSRGRTVDAFTDNLDTLDARERDFDVRAAVVEFAIFGRRMEHFDRTFCDEISALSTIDRLLLGGKSVSPDDTIEALIKACYDHHLSAPLLKRLADPEKAAEDALRAALKGIASGGAGSTQKNKRSRADGLSGSSPADDRAEEDEEEDELDSDFECLRPQYRTGAPPSRRGVTPSALRPIYFDGIAGARRGGADAPDARFDDRGSDADDDRDFDYEEENRGWMELAGAAAADACKRRKMYAERLTKRSLAALDRCVTEQRRELEKALRVNVYGEVLVDAFVAVTNGFSARAQALKLARSEAAAAGARVIDNRSSEEAFDAHRFMMTTLLRRRVDPAMLPSLTHKFFQLVNGPLFDHDRHTFAQPPNTALYFSVENVGLLPHLKEELARFMMTAGSGNSGSGPCAADGPSSFVGGADWTVSRFRGFYDFRDVRGVTTAQRLAWKYIKELILAAALFSSVFRCGEIRVLRADSVATDQEGKQVWQEGIYLTYETECPLVAVLGTDGRGRVTQSSTVILDSDVFSLLYAMLQKMAPGAVERARSEDQEGGRTLGGTRASGVSADLAH